MLTVFDENGNSYSLNEGFLGRETGLVLSPALGGVNAVRIATSTYIGVDGKVYSPNPERSKAYTTPKNIAWAKREAANRGWLWRG